MLKKKKKKKIFSQCYFMLIIIATVEHLLSMLVFDQTQFAVLSDLFILAKQGLLISGDKDNKDNILSPDIGN